MQTIAEISAIIDIATAVTGVLTLVGICITLWFNYRENRTNRYIQIITNQTLTNNNFIRQNFALFATLSRPEVIDEARKRDDFEYKYRIVYAEVNMETQFKYCFEVECNLITCARKICKLCILYYDKPRESLDFVIRRYCEKFYEIMTVYDYADWLYIKSQARSKAYDKGFIDFDKTLHSLMTTDFKESDIPPQW